MRYLDYWYVFFVKTGREMNVLEEAARSFSCEEVKPFLPYVEQLFRKSGTVTKERQLMFPGYLFVETAIPGSEFQERAAEFVQKSKHVMRLLLDCGSEQASVTDEEREAIQGLWAGEEKGIAASKGVIEGDKVMITEGSLVGMEGIIKRIDRHKLKAELEVDFLGQTHRLAVGLEIVASPQVGVL
jgi:transcriptional antiterminator NusG